MRSNGSAAELERRRILAMQRLDEGHSDKKLSSSSACMFGRSEMEGPTRQSKQKDEARINASEQ